MDIQWTRYKISAVYNINVLKNEQFKCVCQVSGQIDDTIIDKQDVYEMNIAAYNTNKTNDNNNNNILPSNQKQNGFKTFMKKHLLF